MINDFFMYRNAEREFLKVVYGRNEFNCICFGTNLKAMHTQVNSFQN